MEHLGCGQPAGAGPTFLRPDADVGIRQARLERGLRRRRPPARPRAYARPLGDRRD